MFDVLLRLRVELAVNVNLVCKWKKTTKGCSGCSPLLRNITPKTWFEFFFYYYYYDFTRSHVESPEARVFCNAHFTKQLERQVPRGGFPRSLTLMSSGYKQPRLQFTGSSSTSPLRVNVHRNPERRFQKDSIYWRKLTSKTIFFYGTLATLNGGTLYICKNIVLLLTRH